MAKKKVAVKKSVAAIVKPKTVSMATTDDVMCIHRRIDRIVAAIDKSKSVRNL